jgi:transmembrane sensor
MHENMLEIEDLLCDDSFINYCKNGSPQDVEKWISFSNKNAANLQLVEAAKERFIQVFNALAMADRDEQENRIMNRLNMVEAAPVVKMQQLESVAMGNVFPLILKLTASVAIVVVAVFFGITHQSTGTKKDTLKTFSSAYGERKNFQLPDGSVVTLNGGSKMSISVNYGISSRDIYLQGEAFFDVKHNKSLPFIVHTAAMDIKALGTAFNVNAYLGEKITETSLVRGVVEVTLKEEQNRKVLLYPNQKVQWKQPSAKLDKQEAEAIKKEYNITPSSISEIQSLTKMDGGDVKEIAWKENKLVFADETFSEIAILLERWYGVKIVFNDDVIRNYRFTGIFEREELRSVLSILKESRNFTYKTVNGETLIVNLYK